MSRAELNEEQRVLLWLNSGKTLTAALAVREGLSGMRLAATIGRMRQKGYPIEGRGTDADPYRMAYVVAAQDANPGPLFADPVSGWVYFIEAVGLGRLKIGHSRDIEARLSQLQTGSAVPLRVVAKVPATQADEADLHYRFRGFRIPDAGTEWFSFSAEILAFIKREAGGLIPAVEAAHAATD